MWQTLIVALIVAAAVLHFSTRYLPAAMRRAIVRGLVRCGLNEEKMSQLFKVAPGCGSGQASANATHAVRWHPTAPAGTPVSHQAEGPSPQGRPR